MHGAVETWTDKFDSSIGDQLDDEAVRRTLRSPFDMSAISRSTKGLRLSTKMDATGAGVVAGAAVAGGAIEKMVEFAFGSGTRYDQPSVLTTMIVLLQMIACNRRIGSPSGHAGAFPARFADSCRKKIAL